MPKKVPQSRQLLKSFEERLAFGEMTLSDMTRPGAQLMLKYALGHEVSSFLGRGYYENASTIMQDSETRWRACCAAVAASWRLSRTGRGQRKLLSWSWDAPLGLRAKHFALGPRAWRASAS